MAKLAAGVASRPQIAFDIDANAVGRALDAIDHEIAEQLRCAKPVVRADVEDVDAAIAAASRVARELREADDVELLLIG